MALVLRMPVVQSINAFQVEKKKSKVRAVMSAGLITGGQVMRTGHGHSAKEREAIGQVCES